MKGPETLATPFVPFCRSTWTSSYPYVATFLGLGRCSWVAFPLLQSSAYDQCFPGLTNVSKNAGRCIINRASKNSFLEEVAGHQPALRMLCCSLTSITTDKQLLLEDFSLIPQARLKKSHFLTLKCRSHPNLQMFQEFCSYRHLINSPVASSFFVPVKLIFLPSPWALQKQPAVHWRSLTFLCQDGHALATLRCIEWFLEWISFPRSTYLNCKW